MIRFREKKQHLQQRAFHNLSFVTKFLAVEGNKTPKKHSRRSPTKIYRKVNEFINQPLDIFIFFHLQFSVAYINSAISSLVCNITSGVEEHRVKNSCVVRLELPLKDQASVNMFRRQTICS